MLTSLVELAERLALRTSPQRAVELLGLIPPPAREAMRRARFRRTLRLAAERSTFYREQFCRRGLDVRCIDHPSQLGDFYTTGEDHLWRAIVGRAIVGDCEDPRPLAPEI